MLASFSSYLLSVMIISSNIFTTYFIFPIIFEYIKTYENINLQQNKYLYGIYIGVNKLIYLDHYRRL
jgi:uncharacterized membrane protein (DUF485 family)